MQLHPVKREFPVIGPVMLVSTMDDKGVLNLAPYSNMMPVLRATDMVCLASWHKRDTLRNMRGNHEFVLSVPHAGMVDQVMITAKHFPPEVDEFAEAGLRPRPSRTVAPPGVEGCLAWMECELADQYVKKDFVIIFGRVKHLEMADEFLSPRKGFAPAKAEPLLMALDEKGMNYLTIRDLGQFRPYGEMFEGGKDSLADLYDSDEE